MRGDDVAGSDAQGSDGDGGDHANCAICGEYLQFANAPCPVCDRPVVDLDPAPASGGGRSIARVFAWVIAFAAASAGVRVGCATLRPSPADHVVADLALTGVDGERVARILTEEMEPYIATPSVRAALEADPRMSRALRGGPEQAYAAGRALGEELSARGIPRLPADELRNWNRIRGLLAAGDPVVCAALWNGGVSPAAIGAQLAALSDDDLRVWARISGHAMELAASAETPLPEPDLGAYLDRMVAQSDVAQRPTLERALDGHPDLTDEEACIAMHAVLDYPATITATDQESYLRALAMAGVPQ